MIFKFIYVKKKVKWRCGFANLHTAEVQSDGRKGGHINKINTRNKFFNVPVMEVPGWGEQRKGCHFPLLTTAGS